MAYLKDIQAWCQAPACQAKASVELFGNKNQPYGKFCRRCGKVKERELQNREDDDSATSKGHR